MVGGTVPSSRVSSRFLVFSSSRGGTVPEATAS
jgi:hypothetical protein